MDFSLTRQTLDCEGKQPRGQPRTLLERLERHELDLLPPPPLPFRARGSCPECFRLEQMRQEV